VVMDRMRAARNNSKNEPHMNHKASETKGNSQKRSGKGYTDRAKKLSETVSQGRGAEIDHEFGSRSEMKGSMSPVEKVQHDSATSLSPKSVETAESRESGASDQKERDALEGVTAWDED
jgi:hypothetical protein